MFHKAIGFTLLLCLLLPVMVFAQTMEKIDEINLAPPSGNHSPTQVIAGNLQTGLLYVAAGNKIAVIDLTINSIIGEIPLMYDIEDLAIDIERNRLYASVRDIDYFENGYIAIINCYTNEVVGEVMVYAPFGLAFNEVDKLYVTGAEGAYPEITVVNVETLAIEKTIYVQGNATGIAIDKELNLIYASSEFHLFVINGLTDTLLADVSSISLAGYYGSDVPVPDNIAVDEMTHTVYGVRTNESRLYAINGETFAIIDSIDFTYEDWLRSVTVHPGLGFVYLNTHNSYDNTNNLVMLNKDTLDSLDAFTFDGALYDNWIDINNISGLFVSNNITNQIYEITPAPPLEIKNTINCAISLTDIAVSEQQNRIYVSETTSGKILVFDSNTNDFISQIQLTPAHTNFYGELSPDRLVLDPLHQKLFVANPGRIGEELSIINCNNNMLIHTVGEPFLKDVSVFPSSNLLYGLASNDYFTNVYAWKFYNGGYNIVYAIDPSPELIYNDIEVNTSTGKVYLAGEEIAIWDSTLTIPIATIDGLAYEATSISIDENNDKVYVSSSYGSSVLVIDALSDTLISEIFVDGRFPTHIEVDTISNFLYATSIEDNVMIIIDTMTDIILGEIEISDNIQGHNQAIALNNNLNLIYIINDINGSFAIIKDPNDLPPAFPPAPNDLYGEARNNKIILTWTKIGEFGYDIYRESNDNSTGTNIIRINPELVLDTIYVDIGLTNGMEYNYWVKSVNLETGLESEAASPILVISPVSEPDFELYVFPPEKVIVRGFSTTFEVSAYPTRNCNYPITLSAYSNLGGVDFGFSPAIIYPYESSQLIISTSTAPVGIHNITITGTYSSTGTTSSKEIQLHIIEVGTDESYLGLSAISDNIFLGQPITLLGKIHPSVYDTVEINIISPYNDTLYYSIDTDLSGHYLLDFVPMYAGEWTAQAEWNGNGTINGAVSELLPFIVKKGNTIITCSTDLPDTAALGKVMLIRGRIFPNPGAATVNLDIQTPAGDSYSISNITINNEGFYGYGIPIDIIGYWEIQASWSGNDNYLGSVSNPLTVPIDVNMGNVIIVVGGEDTTDAFWEMSNLLGNYTNLILDRRRFYPERTYYLNQKLNQDSNMDSLFNDIDGTPTIANLEEAFNWAGANLEPDVPFLLYLVGEMDNDIFYMNNTEILSAVQLDYYLTTLQYATGCNPIIVAIEGNVSGSFIDELAKAGRIIITSTDDIGQSYYLANGHISFSQIFMNAIYQGLSLHQAYLKAIDILSSLPSEFQDQNPQFLNNNKAAGNMGGNDGDDDFSPECNAIRIGALGAIFKDDIKELPLDKAQSGIEIALNVIDAEDNIDEIWAMIVPPNIDKYIHKSNKSLLYFPSVLLNLDENNNYIGIYDTFDTTGVYTILGYATDEACNVTRPLVYSLVVTENMVDIALESFTAETHNNEILLTWRANTNNGEPIIAYRLWREEKDNKQYLINNELIYNEYYLDKNIIHNTHYIYNLEALDIEGHWHLLGEISFIAGLPMDYKLNQNYPNPFNPITTLTFEIPEKTNVELKIYNSLGQLVRTLINEERNAGYHSILWDGKDNIGNEVASGIYFYRLSSNNFDYTRSMVMLK